MLSECKHCGGEILALSDEEVVAPVGLYHRYCYEDMGREVMDHVEQQQAYRATRVAARRAAEAAEPVQCNLCGHSCYLDAGMLSPAAGGLVRAEVTGGYSSAALQDETRYHFSLCEYCLDMLFNLFTVPVKLTQYSDETDVSELYVPALQRLDRSEHIGSFRTEHDKRVAVVVESLMRGPLKRALEED